MCWLKGFTQGGCTPVFVGISFSTIKQGLTSIWELVCLCKHKASPWTSSEYSGQHYPEWYSGGIWDTYGSSATCDSLKWDILHSPICGVLCEVVQSLLSIL